jgi:hypothetical protein
LLFGRRHGPARIPQRPSHHLQRAYATRKTLDRCYSLRHRHPRGNLIRYAPCYCSQRLSDQRCPELSPGSRPERMCRGSGRLGIRYSSLTLACYYYNAAFRSCPPAFTSFDICRLTARSLRCGAQSKTQRRAQDTPSVAIRAPAQPCDIRTTTGWQTSMARKNPPEPAIQTWKLARALAAKLSLQEQVSRLSPALFIPYRNRHLFHERASQYRMRHSYCCIVLGRWRLKPAPTALGSAEPCTSSAGDQDKDRGLASRDRSPG